jgi:hypothetical protein
LQTGLPLGRRLYLWFSGHGITPRGPGEDCAVLMANASLLFLGRSIPGRRVADSFRKRAIFREVVLLMDCCREVLGSADAFLSFDDQGDPTLGDRVGWLYGFATKWASQSAERLLPHPLDPTAPPLWHGVFTHTVLEGLSNAADDHCQITSESLARYVSQRVQDFLLPEDNQRPDFQFSSDHPIVFGDGILTEVKVTLSQPVLGWQIRDGSNLRATVAPPGIALPDGRISVHLLPGYYVFAVPGIGDVFSSAKTVTVVGGSVDVTL